MIYFVIGRLRKRRFFSEGRIDAFNSFIFILLLLPITVIAYFCINIVGLAADKLVIIIASIIFYAYPNWTNFRVLGISLLIKFGAVLLIIRAYEEISVNNQSFYDNELAETKIR